MYNKVNYAVTIDTGTTLTDANIGAYNGVIRFVTDRYEVTSDTYEGGGVVGDIDYWYKDFISKDGMAPMGISINIDAGGDYAYLQGYDVKLVNMTTTGNPYHLMIGSEDMQLNGVYPIGSIVQVYVIIDKVWYPRWNGLVTDTIVDNDYFKFVCEDKNIKEYKLLPSSVVSSINYPNAIPSDVGKAVPKVFGYPQYSKLLVTNKIIEKFIDKSFTVSRLKPNMFETAVDGAGRISNIDSPSTYAPDSTYGDAIPPYMQYWYQTGANSITDFKYINMNNNYYAVVVGAPASFDESTLVGRYVSISNKYNADVDDLTDLHLIREVKTGSTAFTDSQNTKLLYLYVEKSPVKLIDNSCLYGNITNNPAWVGAEPSGLPAVMTMNADSVQSVGHAFIINTNLNGIVSDHPVVYSNTLPSDPWYENATYEDSNVFIYKSVGDGVGVFKSEFVTSANGRIECYSPYIDNATPAHVLHKPNSGKYFKFDSTKWADNFASRSINSVNDVIFAPNAYTKEVPTGIGKRISSQTFDLTDEAGGNQGLCVNLVYNTGDRFQEYDEVEVNYAYEFIDALTYPWGAPHPTVNNSLDVISVGVHAEATDFMGNSVGSPYADVGLIACPYTSMRFEDSDGDKGTWWYTNIVYNSRLINVQDPQKGTRFTNMQYIINPTYKGSLYLDNNRIPVWTHANELGAQDEYFYLDSQQTNINNTINQDIFSELSNDGSLSTWVTIEPKKQSVINNVSSWQPTWSNLKVHYTALGGKMSYKFSDIYLKAYDDTTSNVYTVIKSIMEDTNGLTNVNYTNLETYRSSWKTGRQVTDQQNSFNYIQELCNQSYICGWTGRDGNINYTAFREYVGSTVNHNDTNIIRGSIKNLSRTPLSQVYNEITLKYNWNDITDSFDGVYSIGNVDKDSFPEAYELYPENTSYVDNFMWSGTKGAFFKLGFNRLPPIGQKMSFVTTSGYAVECVVTSLDDRIWTDITYMQTGTPSIITVNIRDIKYLTDFSPYVSGVESYPDAKQLWLTCHKAWLESKTINKAPDGYTNLEWYVESDDMSEDSAYLYLQECVSWMTRQKWKVNYQLKVTPETSTLELMQRVNFSDTLLTGQGQYASGWITGLIVDPNTDLIDIELCFEYFIARPPVIIEECDEIIETGLSDIDIIETGSQPDDITEGICGR